MPRDGVDFSGLVDGDGIAPVLNVRLYACDPSYNCVPNDDGA